MIKKILLPLWLPLLLGLSLVIWPGAADADRVTLFIALPWYFLLERKGYLLLASLLLLTSAFLWIIIDDISLAFLLGIALLALPALLLPGRWSSDEIWVLSSGGHGAFQYNFKKEE